MSDPGSDRPGSDRSARAGRPALVLHAQCDQCFGLCCVAPAFAASADFAIDKPAGTPCPNLRQDFGCGIHQHLRQRGFPGCTVFDCFGAGQQVAQYTYAGHSWRDRPGTAAEMFDVFAVMRQLHELLWYLRAALDLDRATPLRPALTAAADRLEECGRLSPDGLLALDLPELRQPVVALLSRAGDLARAAVPGRKRDYRRADLLGKQLIGANLVGANLRGALLIGADLRQADLRLADLTGADLRGADLRGAALAESLFLTQAQLDAARGDGRTTIPAGLSRPGHW